MTEIKMFLERIGLSKDTEITCDFDFLSKVQYAAVTTISYENLDLVDKNPISLEPKAVFDKIVVNGRGGYCFELNCLLSWFFKKCGFEVKDYFARFLRGEESIPMRRHRVLTVRCSDGVYLCDIGVGQIAPRVPLKVCENLVQTQFGESYCLVKDDFLGWIVKDLHKGEWRNYISFTEDCQVEADFIATSFFCELHPDSNLNKNPIVSIKTEKGRKTINDKEYKMFEKDEIVYLEENISELRFAQLLKDEFNIKNYKKQ